MVDVLVGREAELDALKRALLPLISDGEAVRVVLAAEPGHGKTTFFAELSRWASREGVLVLTGRAPSVGGAVLAFAPLATALARHLDAIAADERAELVAGLPSLSRLVETLPQAEILPADADTERMRLFQAVSLLLARLARARPVVLAIDDLHWADAATVEMLGYLNAELASVPVGLMVALRPGDIDHRHDVRLVIGELLRGRYARRVDLGPLDDDSIVELVTPILGGRPEPRLAAKILARSGGLPLAAEALARELAAGGALRDGADGLDAEGDALFLPGYVVDLFRDRIQALSDDERAVLVAVATAHRPARFEEVAQVSGVAEANRSAVDRLARLHLVTVDSAGGVVEAANPIVTEAALGVAPEAQLRAAHAGWVTVLGAGLARDDEIALHLVNSGDAVAADEAIVVLVAAGRGALSQGATDAAARWLGEAAGRARGATGAGRERLGEILAMQGVAWRRLGEIRAAEVCLREAARELEADQPGRAAALTTQAADLAWVRGERADLDRQFDEALTLARRAGPLDVVRVQAERCHMVGKLADVDALPARVADFEAALADAGPSLVTDLVRFNVNMLVSLIEHSSVADTLELFPDGWETKAGELHQNSFGLALEGYCLLGRWREVEALLDAVRGLDGVRAGARVWRETAARFDMAFAHGQWDRAADLLADEAELPIERLRSRRGLEQAHLLVHRGEFDKAREVAARTRSDSPDQSFGSHAGLAAAVAVELADAEGTPIPAAAEPAMWSSGHVAMAGPVVFAAHGLWLVRSDALDRAHRLVSDLRSMGDADTRLGAIATRIEGLAFARSDPAAGRKALLDSAERFEALAMPFEAARARIEACEAARADGDARLLEGGLSLLEDLGAEPWSERTLALVGRSRRRARHVVLTPREEEVATLVAEGLTNAQIAERLVVSIRTVTSHLDHIFTKLGVGSRTALAAYVLRREEDT